MSNDIIRTKFSKTGLAASIAVFLPYVFSFFPTKYSVFAEISYSPKWLAILHGFISFFLVLTLILIKNMSAEPFSGKSRTISIASITLGVYYILWIYFYLLHSNVWIYLCIKLLGALYLIAYSYDRRNWVSLSLASAYLVTSSTITIVSLVV